MVMRLPEDDFNARYPIDKTSLMLTCQVLSGLLESHPRRAPAWYVLMAARDLVVEARLGIKP